MLLEMQCAVNNMMSSSQTLAAGPAPTSMPSWRMEEQQDTWNRHNNLVT